MRISVFLVIILLVVFWYWLVPIAGAVINRIKWNKFRQHFDELRLRPVLDYRIYRQLEMEEKKFRFIGGFESITDRKTLWIQGENLTIPVSLADAHTYLLPIQKGEGIPDILDLGDETPEKINWNRVTTLTEGARVYVGGSLVYQDERWIFVSTKEEPLIVIFYDGPDRSLTTRTINAGRSRNEYWNGITPYALALGALCLFLVALSFLERPAYRMTVITSVIALFIPLFPIFPPGILLTILFRRLSWQACKLKIISDMARLPLRYLNPKSIAETSAGQTTEDSTSAENNGWLGSQLPNGETYTMICSNSLPREVQKGIIPPIIPELSKSRKKTWYLFGVLHDGDKIPVEPGDPFATFGFLPENPNILSRRYAIKSYTLDIIAWIILILGIVINISFIGIILFLFRPLL